MRKLSIVLMLSLVITLCSVNTWAQAEKPKVQRFFVEEIIVKPGDLSAFDAAAKDMAAALSKFNFPYAVSVFSREDNHYFFSFPIENYADLDKIFDAWSEMIGKWGQENYQALEKRINDSFKSVNHAVIRLVPGMSYIPENPRLNPMEALFRYWGMCYVKPGKAEQVAANFKKMAEIFKENNIDTGFETYVVEFGNDTPLFFYSEIGKSSADFWAHADKTHELLGEEIFKIWNDTLTCFRRYEPTFGMFRPELSYIPKEK